MPRARTRRELLSATAKPRGAKSSNDPTSSAQALPVSNIDQTVSGLIRHTAGVN